MQHFNNYTIIKQIGEGGMAIVYLATHNSLKHQVAIKVLNKEFVFNSNIRSRFIEEARKMFRMSHPNVVKVTDLIDEENSVAIVMEYVEGLTLKDILEQKKLNDNEIELYLKQMLAALGYVHSQGLIHRDIKPSNFILSKEGNLKLTDFGISKALETSTSEHTQTSTAMSLGTPMYMSPEQVRSTKDVTHLTDIYSAGVVLWEMVSKEKPYKATTLSSFDLQLKIVQQKLPVTNTKWDSLIQKATQKEVGKRFESISNFIAALDSKTSSGQAGKVEESVLDFEKTILTQKPVIKKVITENRSYKTFFQKIKGKKYLFLAGVLLISIFIIIFQWDSKTDVSKGSSPQEAIKKAEKQAEEEAKAKAEKQAKDEVEKKKVAEEESKRADSEYIRIGNLEIMDRNFINFLQWEDAKRACESLGNGWRLPTKDELKILYKNRDIIGGFKLLAYWSSSEFNYSDAWGLDFLDGTLNYYGKDSSIGARAVRRI